MKAHLKYYYKVLVNSHKYIAPTLFFIIAVMSTYLATIDRIFYGFQVSAIFMYITAIWITYNFNEIEDSTQKQLVLLNTNNEDKYYIMRISFLFIFVLILDLISIIFPIFIGSFKENVNIIDILIGFLMQAVIGFLGISVANFFESKILKDRKGCINDFASNNGIILHSRFSNKRSTSNKICNVNSTTCLLCISV